MENYIDYRQGVIDSLCESHVQDLISLTHSSISSELVEVEFQRLLHHLRELYRLEPASFPADRIATIKSCITRGVGKSDSLEGKGVNVTDSRFVIGHTYWSAFGNFQVRSLDPFEIIPQFFPRHLHHSYEKYLWDKHRAHILTRDAENALVTAYRAPSLSASEELATATAAFYEDLRRAHGMYLEFKGFSNLGTHLASQARVFICHSCYRHTDARSLLQCQACNWIVCRCGACGCGAPRR